MDTWKIELDDKEGLLTDDEKTEKETSIKIELNNIYQKNEIHYVELKTDWWDLNKDPEGHPVGLMKDIKKKIKKYGTGSIPDVWKPCSLIAMSIVTFYNSENRNDTFDKREIIEKITGLIEENKIPKLNWLYSHIEDNTYLIGAYRTL